MIRVMLTSESISFCRTLLAIPRKRETIQPNRSTRISEPADSHSRRFQQGEGKETNLGGI